MAPPDRPVAMPTRAEAGADAGAPLEWDLETLRAELAPLLPYPPGLSIEVVASVGSTNSVLLDELRAPSATAQQPHAGVRRSIESAAFGRRMADRDPPCRWLVAERQTDGRGRQGRHWRSEAGRSLTFSLALPLEAPDWSGLSLAVGVALADALDPPSTAAVPRIGLKWPNDLWRVDPPGAAAAGGGRKLGGILIESVVAASGRRVAVIGIGLNVGFLEHDAEMSTGVAALREFDPGATPPAVLRRVAPPLLEALRRFEAAGFAPFAAAFARRDLLRGRPVCTTLATAADGIARGVAANGALRVELAGGAIVEVTSGDVSVRPGPAAADAPVAAPKPLGSMVRGEPLPAPEPTRC